MQIFEGSEKELKERFGLNPLVIMWIGILRSKGVYLTEPVIEMCKLNKNLENLLKDRSLLLAIENHKKFQELQKQYNLKPECPLVIIYEGTRKIIALEDEVIAEKGWEKSKKNNGEIPSNKMALEKLESPALQIQGFENLFTKEEIAKIKMAIATAVNSNEKIEAIRKMVISNESQKEKTLLFLHALGDLDVKVRTEAAEALKHIGFNRDIVSSMVLLGTGDDKQIKHSIKSLGNIFKESEEFEKGAILQILLTSLKDKTFRNYIKDIIESLYKMVEHIPSYDAIIERMVEVIINVLVSHLDELLDITIKIFQSLAKKNRDIVFEALWKEIKNTDERRLRAYLLVLISHIAKKEDRIKEIVKKMVYEISFGDELDPIYLKLSARIVKVGEIAIPYLLERYNISIRVTEKIVIVRLLDKILIEYKDKISKEVKENIWKTYVNSYPSALDPLRVVILDNFLLNDKDIDDKLKEEFAKEILLDIHKEKLDESHEAIKSALCKMGKPSINAIINLIENPFHPKQPKRAGEILGDVILYSKDWKIEELIEVKKFCEKEINKEGDHKGEMFKVIGKIAFVCREKDIIEEIIDYLSSNLCKTTYPYEILEGLGWSTASDLCPEDLKTDICYLFMALMDKRLPENIYKIKGKTFEIDVKATAYTDLLPVLIMGLTRLGKAKSTPLGLTHSIIDYLLKKWEDIVSYKILWGPKNTMDLAEALYNLSLLERLSLDYKIKIIEALYKKVDIFTITELLVSFFKEYTQGKLCELAYKTSQKLIEFINSEDYNNPEDKEVLAKCIGEIIQAEKLACDEIESEKMREKLLFTLFEAYRSQVFGVKDILSSLLSCKYINDKLKNEIKKRLPIEPPKRYT